MPDTDSSHTASCDARLEGAEHTGLLRASLPVRVELTELAEAWAASQPRRSTTLQLRLRLVLTLAFILVAAIAMTVTCHQFIFALSGQPVELGDIRIRSLSQAPLPPLADNSHVRMEGLMPTRAHTLRFLEDPAGAAFEKNVYFCPLSNILVITQAPVPAPRPPSSPAPSFAHLVSQGKASIGEVELTISASGRLFRSSSAPVELVPILERFAQLSGTDAASMWLLLDGTTPSDAYWALGVWSFSSLSIVVSLILLWRAYRASLHPHRTSRDAA